MNLGAGGVIRNLLSEFLRYIYIHMCVCMCNQIVSVVVAAEEIKQLKASEFSSKLVILDLLIVP